MLYPRPTEHTLSVVREQVHGECPQCASGDVRRYPVHSEGGWFITIRCQNCLHQLSRDRWTLHGPVEFLADKIEGL